MKQNNTSRIPLEITDEVLDKWQNIITIMAKILNVPAGLIMRIVDSDITVFLSSKTENNPYKVGDSENLEGSGLYCETVIKTKKELLVPNALSDANWNKNPDIKLNMISYLGYPIISPDNTPFGTICVLDEKENIYSEVYKELIISFRDTIERDLELLHKNKDLQESYSKINSLLAEKEILLKEVQHRIKNNILSIQGLLSMQANSTDNAEVKTALKESISRLQSIGVLYKNLLIEKNYDDVSIKNYIERLVDSLVEVFPESKNITIEKNIIDFNLDSKKVIPIGIIMNELMTNIFKHAFKEMKGGHILIELDKTENHGTLTIQDNGIGMGRVDLDESSGFGLSIVRMLAQQLKGTFTIEKHEGTRSVLKFEI